MFRVVFIFVLSVVSQIVVADEFDSFVSTVNTNWVQTNYTAIISAADARLAVDTNDVMGISVKMYYALFVEGDIAAAHTCSSNILSVAQQSGDASAITFAQQLHAEVTEVPLTESGGLSSEAQGQMHSALRTFPFVRRCIGLARTLKGLQ